MLQTSAVAVPARYLGFAQADVDSLFDSQTGQLEMLTMFELLATLEAILRLDFRARVDERRKDPLSRRYRAMRKQNQDKVRLDEDLLTAISQIRGALELRHWLAHGRHWHPKLGQGYVPGDILRIAKDLIAAILPAR